MGLILLPSRNEIKPEGPPTLAFQLPCIIGLQYHCPKHVDPQRKTKAPRECRFEILIGVQRISIIVKKHVSTVVSLNGVDQLSYLS